MRKIFVLITLWSTAQFFGQNDQKASFQKSKYELAISYYKKADFVKAIDLFSLAAKIKPENEIGQESSKKVDTLREVLRKDILEHVLGTWKKAGNHPVWATTDVSENKTDFEEFIQINENEILFFEVNKKTKEKKLLKKENLVYNDMKSTASLFSEIILSDGTIWNCTLSEKSDILRVVNVAVKTEESIEKIDAGNLEMYYVKI